MDWRLNLLICVLDTMMNYKVINVIPLRRAYKPYKVLIYGLSQDSWNLLEFKKSNYYTDKFDLWPYVKARFVNGAAYFVGCNKELGRRVVCFDLSCKIIRQINLPCDNFSLDFCMEEYQDSIALLENQCHFQVVMWELRVSDNSYQWNKKFTIKLGTQALGTYMGAMGFVNKDKLVLCEFSRYSGYKCFLYNLENESKQPLKDSREISRGSRWVQYRSCEIV